MSGDRPLWSAARRFEQVHDAGYPPGNEDAFGQAIAGESLLLWVLDGATSVSDADLLGQGVGDVEWFVNAASAALARAANADVPLASIVRAAVAETKRAYLALLGGRAAADHERPLAAFAMARLSPLGGGRFRVEAARLGDCAVFLAEDKSAKALTGLHDTVHERASHARVREQREGGVRDEAAVKALNLARLRRERAHLHGPGMRVFGLDETVGVRLLLETVETTAPFGVLLLTDGFFRGVELYGQWTADAFALACLGDGLAPVLARVRAEEESPGTLDRHPRLKRRDDATALLVEV